MDEWNSYGEGMKVDRYATDWGLASFLIGGLLVSMAPAQLIFNLLYFKSGAYLGPRAEMDAQKIATVVYAVGIGAVLAVSLFAGLRGLSAARRRKQPAALPLVGILATGLAALMWTGLTFHIMAIQGWF